MDYVIWEIGGDHPINTKGYSTRKILEYYMFPVLQYRHPYLHMSEYVTLH